MKLEAFKRILAEFDYMKSDELNKIYRALIRVDFDFNKGDGNLFFDGADSEDMQAVADELNKIGYKLRITPGIFDKPTFALKGKNNLVLQKVDSNTLRIFFTRD